MMIRTTQSGFQIAGPLLRLPGPRGNFQQPYLAVVGRNGRPFTQDLLVHAERLLHAHAPASQLFGARLLAYLAQVGVWHDERRPVGSRRMRWPPIAKGALSLQRNCWKRPWLSLTGIEVHRDLRRALAAHAAETDVGETLKEAVSTIPATTEGDLWLSNAAYWRVFELDYGEPTEDARMKIAQRAILAARTWVAAPRHQNPAEAFQTLIDDLAEARDLSGLAAALELVQAGHLVYHAAVRHQQQMALEEAAGNSGIRELQPTLEGIHRLLYEAHSAFGLESWQFAGNPSDGTFRMVLPELVGLVRDLRGRRWLDALMSAYAREDEASVATHLAEYRESLGDVASYQVDTRAGSDAPPTRRMTQLDEDKTPDPRAWADAAVEVQDEGHVESLDPAAKWTKLLSNAGPRQQQLIQAWRANPDLSLAEIARLLGTTPAAVEQAKRRLRRRRS